MITLIQSDKFKKDLNKYKKISQTLQGRYKEKLDLLIETYTNFANQIEVAHSSQYTTRVDPRLVRDVKTNLTHTREQIEKLIKQLDN